MTLWLTWLGTSRSLVPGCRKPDLAVGGLQDLALGATAISPAPFLGDSYAELAQRYLVFSDNLFMSDDAVTGYAIVRLSPRPLERSAK